MKSFIRFVSIFSICIVLSLYLNTDTYAQGQGQGKGKGLVENRGLENGQGFTTGQGHLNGNSAVDLGPDCVDIAMEKVLAGYLLGTYFVERENENTFSAYYERLTCFLGICFTYCGKVTFEVLECPECVVRGGEDAFCQFWVIGSEAIICQ